MMTALALAGGALEAECFNFFYAFGIKKRGGTEGKLVDGASTAASSTDDLQKVTSIRFEQEVSSNFLEEKKGFFSQKYSDSAVEVKVPNYKSWLALHTQLEDWEKKLASNNVLTEEESKHLDGLLKGLDEEIQSAEKQKPHLLESKMIDFLHHNYYGLALEMLLRISAIRTNIIQKEGAAEQACKRVENRIKQNNRGTNGKKEPGEESMFWNHFCQGKTLPTGGDWPEDVNGPLSASMEKPLVPPGVIEQFETLEKKFPRRRTIEDAKEEYNLLQRLTVGRNLQGDSAGAILDILNKQKPTDFEKFCGHAILEGQATQGRVETCLNLLTKKLEDKNLNSDYKKNLEQLKDLLEKTKIFLPTHFSAHTPTDGKPNPGRRDFLARINEN